MRGKRNRIRRIPRHPRNIPAHAGKTFSVSNKPSLTLEHPRACGENRATQLTRQHSQRNIPAHAGKTGLWLITLQLQPWNIPAHAGKTGGDLGVYRISPGTSPRMRGKLGVVAVCSSPIRNIPAHAGKTVEWYTRSATAKEHPRACGENETGFMPPASWKGTSPRMRGKRRRSRWCRRGRRNIPAHAGKTVSVQPQTTTEEEHPRACGENFLKCGQCAVHKGTSPRMRGKPQGVPGGFNEIRNIPAHAGKTGTSPSAARLPTEHPRACGENNSRFRSENR